MKVSTKSTQVKAAISDIQAVLGTRVYARPVPVSLRTTKKGSLVLDANSPRGWVRSVVKDVTIEKSGSGVVDYRKLRTVKFSGKDATLTLRNDGLHYQSGRVRGDLDLVLDEIGAVWAPRAESFRLAARIDGDVLAAMTGVMNLAPSVSSRDLDLWLTGAETLSMSMGDSIRRGRCTLPPGDHAKILEAFEVSLDLKTFVSLRSKFKGRGVFRVYVNDRSAWFRSPTFSFVLPNTSVPHNKTVAKVLSSDIVFHIQLQGVDQLTDWAKTQGIARTQGITTKVRADQDFAISSKLDRDRIASKSPAEVITTEHSTLYIVAWNASEYIQRLADSYKLAKILGITEVPVSVRATEKAVAFSDSLTTFCAGRVG